MLKKAFGSIIIFTLALWNSYAVLNMPDTIHLNEIVITGRKAPAVYSELSRIVTIVDRKEIERMPVQSLSGILEYIMSVDVRERGALGVQADLSIKGSSFEQVLILLNGMKMNDPQTGHHHLNIPVDIQSIERIEILEGPGSRIFGPYAYTGAVNIITRNPENHQFGLSLAGGQHSYLNAGLFADFRVGSFENGLSVNRKSSAGYIGNTDFVNTSLFYSASARFRQLITNFQAGYLQKEFGANSFYTPLYPDQFEAVKASFLSLNNTYGDRSRLNHKIYYRRHNDRFELFRYQTPDWYRGHNYHKTDVYGSEILYTLPWRFGTSAFGTELRTEKIFSNVLGEPMNDTIWLSKNSNAYYNKFKRRDHISIFGEHNFYWTKLNLSFGILANYNGDYGWSLFPGLDFSYNMGERVKVFASYNQSVRMPSFTDLFYTGPTNIGNPDLKPEIARTYEAGLKYLTGNVSGHFQVFYRQGRNIIDWVRIADSLKWESLNITRLSTTGFDVRINKTFDEYHNRIFPIEKLTFGYSYINVTKQSGNYISAYALDQLRHKLGFVLQHSISNNLKGLWHLTYQDRAGTYTHFPSGEEVPYQDFIVVDVKLIYRLNRLNIFAEATNLLNSEYIDYGNIIQPGRWIRFGVNSKISLK